MANVKGGYYDDEHGTSPMYMFRESLKNVKRNVASGAWNDDDWTNLPLSAPKKLFLMANSTQFSAANAFNELN